MKRFHSSPQDILQCNQQTNVTVTVKIKDKEHTTFVVRHFSFVSIESGWQLHLHNEAFSGCSHRYFNKKVKNHQKQKQKSCGW